MPHSAVLKLAPTATGCLLRVEGRGTMRESRAAHELAIRCLPTPDCTVAFDLSACENLDSTFLGCLIDLQRRFGRGQNTRFAITSPSESCRRLFETAQVQRALTIAPDSPPTLADFLTLPAAAMDSPQMPEHILNCHRLLSEFEGPSQPAFRAIADQLAKELAAREPQVH
jgi:anti-anti-sigma regulatory factor